jgi:hypothetical protein
VDLRQHRSRIINSSGILCVALTIFGCVLDPVKMVQHATRPRESTAVEPNWSWNTEVVGDPGVSVSEIEIASPGSGKTRVSGRAFNCRARVSTHERYWKVHYTVHDSYISYEGGPGAYHEVRHPRRWEVTGGEWVKRNETVQTKVSRPRRVRLKSTRNPYGREGWEGRYSTWGRLSPDGRFTMVIDMNAAGYSGPTYISNLESSDFVAWCASE